MSYARQGLILAVLAALALGGWYVAQQAGLLQAAAPEAGRTGRGAWGGGMQSGVPVIAEPVQTTTADVRVEAVGTGEATTGVTIYPAVAGEVAEIGFAAGQSVAAGDVLLKLDDAAERLAVDLAKVEVKDAEVTLSRFRKAAPTGAVSATEVDAARTALDRAKLQLEQAQVALADRTIRAPFGGVVGPAEVDPGDRVTSATAITTLDDRSSITVTFDVPEIYADQVRPGERIQVTPWSMSGRSFDGIVAATGSRIDPVSRSLQVRARVANPEDLLRPGMSFVVVLEIPGEAYASVPEIAVLWSRDGAYVWRVGERPDAASVAAATDADPAVPRVRAAAERPPGGAAAAPALPPAVRVPVQVHRRDRGRVLLEGPLAAGDLVVVEGVQRVREGSALRLVGPAGGAAAPGTSALNAGNGS